MGWDNYTYKKPEYPERKPGKYRCIILKAEIGTSKAGNRMIIISLRPSGTTATVSAYIVDNEYFDDNYSKFLDAFPQIKENPDPNTCFAWRGAHGAINLKVNDNGYWQAGNFIPAERAEFLPEFEWKAGHDEPQEMPIMQEISALGFDDEEPDDEVPF